MDLNSTNITEKNRFWKIPFTFVICFFLGSFVINAEDTSESIHYRLGVKYKSEQKYDEAIEEFRKVLAAYPDNFNAYMHMAEIRDAQGRSRLVIYNLKKALTNNPGWGKAHKMLAATYEKDGQIQKAIIELQQYQQSSDPAERDSLQSQIDRLIAQVNSGNRNVSDSTQVSEALQQKATRETAVQKKSKVSSGQTEQLFKSAVQLFNAQNYQAALSKFREVIRLDSQHSGSYYYAGLIRLKQGQKKMAKINFRNASGYSGLDYTAHYYLGKIYADEKNYTEAVSHLSKYIAVTNHEPGKKEALGLIEKYKKLAADVKPSKAASASAGKNAAAENKKEATFSVQQVVAPEKYVSLEIQVDSTLTMLTVDTLTDAGQKLLAGIREFSAGNFDRSILEFKKVLVTNPGTNTAVACIFNTGVCYLKLNLFKDAENQFQQIIDRYSSHPAAIKSRFLKALTYQNRSEPVIAEKLYRHFLQSYRTHRWAPMAFEKLGDCYVELEQYKNAAEAYTQAVKISRDTHKIGILFKTGTVYSHLENDKRAIQNFQSAIELGEKTGVYARVPDCCYRIADSYYKSKDYQKSMALYKKATRKYPAFQETAWGLFQIGSIYKNLKQYKNAVDAFKDLIRRYPDDYWAKQAQWKLEDSIWENEYMAVIN